MADISQFGVLDKSAWKERMEGWLVVGGSLRAGPVVSLALRKDIPEEQLSRLWDAEVPTRVFYFNLLTGVSGYDQFDKHMPFPKIGSSEVPESLTICAARESMGPAWVANRDYAEIELISPNGAKNGSESFAAVRMARIGGSAYAVGLFRDVFKRTGRANWTKMDSGLPSLSSKQISATSLGFQDLDGLTEDNMYAVGGHGDVWRYDGSRWKQCDFPSNKQLDTVTVAPDGQVYISGQSGSLWVGREDTWSLLVTGSSSVPYNDSRWFNGKLWLISDYQLHVFEEGELRRPTHNGSKLIYTGWMDCTDELMVIATNSGSVHVSDGKDWKTVIRPYS